MNSIEVKSKDVKDIIKATFPGNRKRKAYIVPTNSVRLSDLNWSGGTRAEYRACTLDGKSISSKVDMSMPAPWNNPYEGLEVEIPEGAAIVEGGYFCGKELAVRIHVRPDSVAKLIDYVE